MKELACRRLRPSDAPRWSRLLTGDSVAYRKYFTPFSTRAVDLRKRLRSARVDCYWGVFVGKRLVAFFMLRGFDEGYARPSFGVYVAKAFAGNGVGKLALDYSVSWCRLNGVRRLMLKVRPDNLRAKSLYERQGFVFVGVCPDTGHLMMEKAL